MHYQVFDHHHHHRVDISATYAQLPQRKQLLLAAIIICNLIKLIRYVEKKKSYGVPAILKRC